MLVLEGVWEEEAPELLSCLDLECVLFRRLPPRCRGGPIDFYCFHAVSVYCSFRAFEPCASVMLAQRL